MNGEKVFIIAEAGVNHNGSLVLAKNLVDAAIECGADAVKFQTFNAGDLVSVHALKAAYQLTNTGIDETQLEMLKKYELSYDDHVELIQYCIKNKIIFISSPFDMNSIDLLSGLGLEILKIPSGEITNTPYLRKIGKLGKKIIMSTGMATLGEVENALKELLNSGTAKADITLLHCTTEYPAPVKEVNLTAMITLRDAFKVEVGYSDHTLGMEVPLAAVALGARVIEKHITLDNSMAGPDHKASMEPPEFKKMAGAIRNVEKALGNGIKSPSQSENINKDIVRKSIVAARPIKKQETFSEENITVKRPGGGISPLFWDFLIGKKSGKDYNKDEYIELIF